MDVLLAPAIGLLAALLTVAVAAWQRRRARQGIGVLPRWWYSLPWGTRRPASEGNEATGTGLVAADFGRWQRAIADRLRDLRRAAGPPIGRERHRLGPRAPSAPARSAVGPNLQATEVVTPVRTSGPLTSPPVGTAGLQSTRTGEARTLRPKSSHDMSAWARPGQRPAGASSPTTSTGPWPSSPRPDPSGVSTDEEPPKALVKLLHGSELGRWRRLLGREPNAFEHLLFGGVGKLHATLRGNDRHRQWAGAARDLHAFRFCSSCSRELTAGAWYCLACGSRTRERRRALRR